MRPQAVLFGTKQELNGKLLARGMFIAKAIRTDFYVF
jgi:hypothetical protein